MIILAMEVRIPISLVNMQWISINNMEGTTTILGMDLKGMARMERFTHHSKVNMIIQPDIIRITSEFESFFLYMQQN